MAPRSIWNGTVAEMARSLWTGSLSFGLVNVPVALLSAVRDRHIDDYRQPLPAEWPGAPVRGASFERAKRLMCDYALADPAIVRAVYDPAAGLANPQHAARGAIRPAAL